MGHCRKCRQPMEPGKRCAPCKAAYNRARLAASPEKQQAQREHSRRSYLANKEKVNARSRDWATANPERMKEILQASEARNKEARRARHHELYLVNAAKVMERTRARRQANPAKFRAYAKKSAAKYPEKTRARWQRTRLRRYGISRAEYDALLVAQGGACKICCALTPGPHSWHVDHDHACCPGKKSCGRCVRGLLCSNCNLLLGHAGDSPDVLRKAIDYLVSRPALRLVSD